LDSSEGPDQAATAPQRRSAAQARETWSVAALSQASPLFQAADSLAPPLVGRWPYQRAAVCCPSPWPPAEPSQTPQAPTHWSRPEQPPRSPYRFRSHSLTVACRRAPDRAPRERGPARARTRERRSHQPRPAPRREASPIPTSPGDHQGRAQLAFWARSKNPPPSLPCPRRIRSKRRERTGSLHYCQFTLLEGDI
jgi:hypothetical protein